MNGSLSSSFGPACFSPILHHRMRLLFSQQQNKQLKKQSHEDDDDEEGRGGGKDFDPISDLEECYRTALSYSIAGLNAAKAQDLLAALGNYRRACCSIEQCPAIGFVTANRDLYRHNAHLVDAIKSLHTHCKDHMTAVAVVVADEREKKNIPIRNLGYYSRSNSQNSLPSEYKRQYTMRTTLRKGSKAPKSSNPLIRPTSPPPPAPPPHSHDLQDTSQSFSSTRAYSSSAIFDPIPLNNRKQQFKPSFAASSASNMTYRPAENASRAAILAWRPSVSNLASTAAAAQCSSTQSVPEFATPQETLGSRLKNIVPPRPHSNSCDSLISLSPPASTSIPNPNPNPTERRFITPPPLPPRTSDASQPCPESSESSAGLNNNSNRELAALARCKNVDETLAKTILNEIVSHGDEVHWNDISGLEEAKMALKEAVVYPFLRPDLFKGLREPARGMLLFGPPGTGKTMLARAVATESNATFFQISSSSLTSKYLGDSEKLVRALFSLAKELQPSIIFVDEIDSLLSARTDSGSENETSRRLKTEFLIQWSSLAKSAAAREDTLAPKVLVLAATNLPWQIDEAARRRFVRRQYIPLPERETRKSQFNSLLQFQRHNLSANDLDWLILATDGYSGSDITALTKDAAMGPLRELGESLLTTQLDLIRPITLKDFKSSLKTIKPSVSKNGLGRYEDWHKEFGSQ